VDHRSRVIRRRPPRRTGDVDGGRSHDREVDVAVIAEVILRGITKEQYDAVRARTRWVEQAPDGGLGHLAWWEGGDCHGTDAWESEEAFQAFGEQRLGPAMAELGIDAPLEVTFHPAHEVYLPERALVTATGAPQRGGNAELTRQGYERFGTGDIAGVLALFDDELVWTTPASIRYGGVYRGPSGAGEFFSRLPQLYDELRVEPATFIDAGDVVVVEGMHHGRSTTGNAFDVPFVHVWHWRAGKATRFTEVMDSAPVARALGQEPAEGTTTIPSARRYGEGAGGPAASDTEALLRRMFDEVINQGRLEVADELFAEDFVDHGPMGRMEGRETFKQMIRQWRDAVPDVHCEIDTVIVEGDLCAWLVRTTGTHTGGGLGFPATNRRFETVSANIGRFRDGLAAEHWAEQGMFPMLTQLGVVPLPSGAPA
jgi:ketosteroid isomerase-like protein